MGWEHGKLDSLDRFADICEQYKADNDGFVLAFGEEYGIRNDQSAVVAFRTTLRIIADEVADEVHEKYENLFEAEDAEEPEPESVITAQDGEGE